MMMDASHRRRYSRATDSSDDDDHQQQQQQEDEEMEDQEDSSNSSDDDEDEDDDDDHHGGNSNDDDDDDDDDESQQEEEEEEEEGQDGQDTDDSGEYAAVVRNAYSALPRGIIRRRRRRRSTDEEDEIHEEEEEEVAQESAGESNKKSKIRSRDLRAGGSKFEVWKSLVEEISGTKRAKDSSKQKPMVLAPSRHPEFVIVSLDGLSATYAGKGSGNGDRKDSFHGRVTTSRPIPKDANVFYFEASITCKSAATCDISIGFAFGEDVVDPDDRALGCSKFSFGYSGRNGSVHLNGKRALSSRSPFLGFGNGDVVGAGVNRITNEIFFTRNGRISFQQTLLKPLKLSLTPSLSLHNSEEEVKVIFGPEFTFDLDEMIKGVKAGHVAELAEYPSNHKLVSALVHDYLKFQGYKDTLAAFKKESSLEDCNEKDAEETEPPPLEQIITKDFLAKVSETGRDYASVETRSKIRQMIMNHKPLEAEELLYKIAPAKAVEYFETQGTFEHLRGHAFVELIREGKCTLAIKFAREKLLPSMAKKLVPLIAYKDPKSSPHGALLTTEYMEGVADFVNRSIIQASQQQPDDKKPRRLRSALDTVLTQMLVAKVHLGSHHYQI